MNKNLAIAVLSLFLALYLVFQYLYHSNRSSVENSLKTDTITITKIDTVTVIKPVIQYKYITQVITDTLYNTDSIKVPVQIPIESKIYQDSSYRAVHLTPYRFIQSIPIQPSPISIRSGLILEYRQGLVMDVSLKSLICMLAWACLTGYTKC